jgi:sortase (surface protein transpeptidase)
LLGVGLMGLALVLPRLPENANAGRVSLPNVPPLRTLDNLVAEIGQNPQSSAGMRLTIPAIHIDAPVDRLSRLSNGEIEAPHQWDHVGWYSDGPAPGQPGVAVFLGHVDSHTGAAVFYRLHEIQPAALITISEGGNSRVFVVNDVRSYSEAAVPLRELLVDSGPSKIALLTCSGDFNPATGRYNDRLVVVATEQSEP